MPSVDKGAGLRMTAPWDASCFAKPANPGLNRLVSKHRAYRAGTSPNWVNVKNPAHPAMARVKEAFAPKCYHNRKLLRGRAHSESSKLMDSAQRCRVSPDSPATTQGSPPASPGVEGYWFCQSIGASLRRGRYSLDSPFPPCILHKQSQGRDRE
jgi:hypothetical protein